MKYSRRGFVHRVGLHLESVAVPPEVLLQVAHRSVEGQGLGANRAFGQLGRVVHFVEQVAQVTVEASATR